MPNSTWTDIWYEDGEVPWLERDRLSRRGAPWSYVIPRGAGKTSKTLFDMLDRYGAVFVDDLLPVREDDRYDLKLSEQDTEQLLKMI